MNSTREERPLRRRLVPPFVALGLGLLFLVMSLSQPTIANLRWHVIVRLLATGGFLGVGLVWLVEYFGGRRAT